MHRCFNCKFLHFICLIKCAFVGGNNFIIKILFKLCLLIQVMSKGVVKFSITTAFKTIIEIKAIDLRTGEYTFVIPR
jgi:hypothetical protein